MASPTRYFINPYINQPASQLRPDVDHQKWKDRVLELAQHIQTNEARYTKDHDGGLYVGPAGVAYSFYYLTTAPGLAMEEKEKAKYLKFAMDLVEDNAGYYEKPEIIRDKRNLLGFLTGAAGVFAVASAIASASKLSEARIQSYLKKFSSLAQHFIPVQVHKCGSDEMFVGRAGYISAALWLKSINPKLDVGNDVLFKICDAIVASGRQYAKSRPNNGQQPSPPLMFAYYQTEYLGAGHGLCAILQMLLSVPGYIQQCSADVVNDIKLSIQYLLSLQTTTGNFPCAMDEAPPYRQRSDQDELVHWCHGAPGTVYLLAKAHQIWNDSKYLDAAVGCGECVWNKGLLKKGPGICHGVAGSGYVFLLLYRITNDKKYLSRAISFGEFMYTDQFNRGSRQPDCPFSLYEGLAGTMCYLTDLLVPEKSAFPFLDVFSNIHS